MDRCMHLVVLDRTNFFFFTALNTLIRRTEHANALVSQSSATYSEGLDCEIPHKI